MAINYTLVRAKINELNLSAIKIVDILAILERGTLFNAVVNSGLLVSLNNEVKLEGSVLKDIASDIKTLVN